ncbi:MAG: entericidin, EcnA/B family [Pseudomonadota bacterium]
MRFIVLALTLMLISCNTVQGIGEDLTSAGKKGEEIIKGDK